MRTSFTEAYSSTAAPTGQSSEVFEMDTTPDTPPSPLFTSQFGPSGRTIHMYKSPARDSTVVAPHPSDALVAHEFLPTVEFESVSDIFEAEYQASMSVPTQLGLEEVAPIPLLIPQSTPLSRGLVPNLDTSGGFTVDPQTIDLPNAVPVDCITGMGTNGGSVDNNMVNYVFQQLEYLANELSTSAEGGARGQAIFTRGERRNTKHS